MKECRRFTVDEAHALLPGMDEVRSAIMFERGTLSVQLYAPRVTDPQTPHEQDEIYIVVRGRGDFTGGGERWSVGPGDVLFVPAGVEHRFEEFSHDLVVWVVFHGPAGGERP